MHFVTFLYEKCHSEESCTFQKIYGLGKIKLKIKWPGRLEKNTNLVENLKEIN
jgi:hypothetical protein